MSLPNTVNLALPFGITLPEVNSLHIEFNGHMSSYATIEEYYEGCLRSGEQWVSPEDRAKAIGANSVWCVHWYNKTPGGSWSVLASSLEAALRAIAESGK